MFSAESKGLSSTPFTLNGYGRLAYVKHFLLINVVDNDSCIVSDYLILTILVIVISLFF